MSEIAKINNKLVKGIFDMKKFVLILAILISVIILTVGCTAKQTQKASLSDLQIEACNSADAAKTCDTRLAEVGIVLKEDCCRELGKCC